MNVIQKNEKYRNQVVGYLFVLCVVRNVSIVSISSWRWLRKKKRISKRITDSNVCIQCISSSFMCICFQYAGDHGSQRFPEGG